MDAHRYYETLATNHATPEWFTFTQRRRLIESSLRRYGRDGRGLRLLDAGCGEGQFLEVFAQLGFEPHGLDIAPTAAAKARERVPEAEVVVASLEEPLPFPAGQFDVIWCTEVIEHLFDVGATLREFRRILRPQGLLLLTTPYHGFLKNIAVACGAFERHYSVTGPHIRFFTQRSLGSCLRQAGFEPLRWAGFGRGWPLYKSFFVASRVVLVEPNSGSEVRGQMSEVRHARSDV